MNKTAELTEEESRDLQIQENITNWQSNDDPLAPLTDEQLDIIYEVNDLIQELYFSNEQSDEKETVEKEDDIPIPFISKNKDFIRWMMSAEEDVKYENLSQYEKYHELLWHHLKNCENLFLCSSDTLESLNNLKEKYEDVTSKTNYLHDLSEQLMAQQRLLKEKKTNLNEKLKAFSSFNKTQENVERLSNKINSQDYLDILNHIDKSMEYLKENIHYKESRIYRMKYESLLSTALNKIYSYVENIVTETTKQVMDPEFKAQIVPLTPNPGEGNIDSAFSLYYGKFQSASSKVKFILQSLEEKVNVNDQYKNTVSDCQKIYLTQRAPILGIAVSKALTELKDKHRTDHSILFRSCSLFTMKVCQDEARCYSYFFEKPSEQLNEYLASLCQHLYDTLRPCLITINHIEVLSELCGILKKEMLNDKILGNEHLIKYVETIRQLLQDVEERLVFRTNVFFQHELLGYKSSPGDLAYPEKLVQMENITLELGTYMRTDSRASVVSMESQEVANINSTHAAQFRSFTGNSPADLHGMWYPTVKRTLVCLSRLYFCLDRDTFQGLAQEALVICIRTVQTAAELISSKKTPIDGGLFQIKHLLIIREQIAPFQVDFTVKEVALDFSSVHKAAIELIQKRNNLFTFGTNNALLEFLLEGTPKVKEYLIDSRKEIDKQLKKSCEDFIQFITKALVGPILVWIAKAEHIYKISEAQNNPELTVRSQDFAQPALVGNIIMETQKIMKAKIPDIQRSMQLYLANRETEFILFRPIKNNVINAFMQLDQMLIKGGFSEDDQLQIACPSPEQINILICSVSLAAEQEVTTAVSSASQPSQSQS